MTTPQPLWAPPITTGSKLRTPLGPAVIALATPVTVTVRVAHLLRRLKKMKHFRRRWGALLLLPLDLCLNNMWRSCGSSEICAVAQTCVWVSLLQLLISCSIFQGQSWHFALHGALEPAGGGNKLCGSALWLVDYPCISDLAGFSYGCGYSVFDEAYAVQA
jgi:hypothetical protein